MPEETTLRCPDCDGERFVTRCTEIVRVTHEVDVLSYDGGPFVREWDEVDREILDTERDDATIICDDCGAEWSDPQDILDQQDGER